MNNKFIECPVCSAFTNNLDQQHCKMCDWDLTFTPKCTRKEAEDMLIHYWTANGKEYDREDCDISEIQDIMYGDLRRLMIDPHKYDYLNEE